jgi:ribonuclease E
MEPQSPEPRETRDAAPEGPPQSDRPARTGRSRRGGRRRRRGAGSRDQGIGGQGGGPGGSDVSIDTQTGFDGDTGQQEMGWTGPPAHTSATQGDGEGPEHHDHGAPAPSAPAYAPQRRPDEASPRLSGPTAGTPELGLERGSEHAPHAASPPAEHRPQVAWSAAPPTAGEQGFDGPAREE